MLFLCSCAGEFNRVYKSADDGYKYEFDLSCLNSS